jgi:PAS domain S-box-containing protein
VPKTNRTKMSRKDREASELRLRSVMDTMTDAVISSEAGGLIRYFNQSAEKMFGRSAENAIGQPLTILMPEQFRELHRAGIERYMETGKGRVVGKTVELTGLRADGTEFPIELSLSSWRSQEGVLVTAIIRDISERKRAEQEREALADNARHLGDIQDLVIRIVGHDLKAPIAVMQGYLKMVEGGLDAPVAQVGLSTLRGHVRKAEEAASSMLVLMGNARAISRLTMENSGRAKFESIDVDRLIRETAEMLRPLASSKSIELAVASAPGLRLAVAPGFESVVSNLIGNAIKYTPSGGRVDVKVSEGVGTVLIDVEDTGPGIAPEQRARLFKKFERLGLEQTVGSHGLGLSIAASLVELSGGTITANDRADGRKGSVFRVEIPRQPG